MSEIILIFEEHAMKESLQLNQLSKPGKTQLNN